MRVESVEHEGSVFFFTVECAKVLEGEDSAPVAADPLLEEGLLKRQFAAKDLRKLRILVAEDDAMIQFTLLAFLKKFGVRADAVSDGQHALELLKSTPFDLILLDCQMPRRDGYETARTIRDPESEVCDHGIPIIAVTAHAMKGEREKCLAAGMNDYLTKPVRKEDLERILCRWLPGGQGPSPPRVFAA